jgi:hypothetical protein
MSARVDKNVDARINEEATTSEMEIQITDEESKASCVTNLSLWIETRTHDPRGIAETIEGKWTSGAGMSTLTASDLAMATWGRGRVTTCAVEGTFQTNTVAASMS